MQGFGSKEEYGARRRNDAAPTSHYPLCTGPGKLQRCQPPNPKTQRSWGIIIIIFFTKIRIRMEGRRKEKCKTFPVSISSLTTGEWCGSTPSFPPSVSASRSLPCSCQQTGCSEFPSPISPHLQSNGSSYLSWTKLFYQNTLYNSKPSMTAYGTHLPGVSDRRLFKSWSMETFWASCDKKTQWLKCE